MYISAKHYGNMHPITGVFKNPEMEQLYKRYLATYHRKYLMWCFGILAILNTLMFVVDIRNIPVSEGGILFALRVSAYPVLGTVARMLYKGGFSYWYCRCIFAVVILMTTIVMYRYHVLHTIGHLQFDFGVQISALMLVYILCASMIILPLMANYLIVICTATVLIIHTLFHEPDTFLIHKISWGVYAIASIVITTLAIWIRRHSRYQFYHFHIKPKAQARAIDKNTVLEKIKNAFMANATAQVLAHELKTPLATAYGYAQMTDDARIQNALEKMNNIIQNINYLGKGKIKQVCVKTRTLIKGTSDLWFTVAETTHGTVQIIDTLSPHDTATICVDDVLLQGGIANVIRNGLQVRPHGIVTLTISSTQTDVQMRISNNTPRPTYLNDNVFMPMWDQDMWDQDMYEQDMCDNNTEDTKIFSYPKPEVHKKEVHKKSESIGVGLAFVYDTITRMRGNIYIDYQVDNSTDFVITIPRHVG